MCSETQEKEKGQEKDPSREAEAGARAISWMGAVDQENFNVCITQIYELCSEDPEESIELYICSQGGASSLGFALYDNVRFIQKANLKTIVLGHVASIAILIFLAGKKRYICKNSEISFHEFARHFDSNTRYNATELLGIAQGTMNTQQCFIKIVVENCSGLVTAKTVEKWMMANKTLSAEETLKYGLVHTILE